MPPRSQVITMLPAHIRRELERRLFQNGFRDYQGLAQWVRGEGYNISDDSLWRYGRSLQQEMLAARVSALQAAAGIEAPASAPVTGTRPQPHLTNEPESSVAAVSAARAYRASPQIAAVLANAANYVVRRFATPNPLTDILRPPIASAIP